MNEQLFQTLTIIFGLLISALGFCVAWFVNTLWNRVSSQDARINAVDMKIASQYPTREEIDKKLDRLFDAVDSISKEVTHISRNQASIKTLKEMLGKEHQG